MSERLQRLRRQQELIREHLGWIEAEIARELAPRDAGAVAPESAPTRLNKQESASAAFADHVGGISPQASARHTAAISSTSDVFAPNAPTSPTRSTVTTSLNAETQAMFDQYSAAESNKREDARLGCFIIFAVALTVLILGVAAVWWFGYRKIA